MKEVFFQVVKETFLNAQIAVQSSENPCPVSLYNLCCRCVKPNLKQPNVLAKMVHISSECADTLCFLYSIVRHVNQIGKLLCSFVPIVDLEFELFLTNWIFNWNNVSDSIDFIQWLCDDGSILFLQLTSPCLF